MISFKEFLLFDRIGKTDLYYFLQRSILLFPYFYSRYIKYIKFKKQLLLSNVIDDNIKKEVIK